MLRGTSEGNESGAGHRACSQKRAGPFARPDFEDISMKWQAWLLAAVAIGAAHHLARTARPGSPYRRADGPGLWPSATPEAASALPASPNPAEALPAAGIGGQRLADESARDPEAALPGMREFLRGA
jgi:hypothetical protein